MKSLEIAVLWAVGLAACTGFGAGYPAAVDATNCHAWSENSGWLRFSTSYTNATAVIDGGNGYLTGYAWGENVGWIKLGSGDVGPYSNTSSSNWGVNMDADWDLSGYAWSESIGWINFNPAHGQVAIDRATGQFTGYAWSENAGWIQMGSTGLIYQLRVELPQATNNVPEWWLWEHGVTNGFDVAAMDDLDADGMATWAEYVAGTDPTNSLSFLGILHPDLHDVTESDNAVTVTWYSVEGRLYDVYRAESVTDSAAFALLGSNIVGQAGETSYVDTDLPAVSNMFYRIQVRQ